MNNTNAKIRDELIQKQSLEFLLILILISVICGLLFKMASLFYVSMAFALLGLLRSQWIHPLYRLWMKLAHGLSLVMNTLILGLVFVFVVVPVSFLKRSQLRPKFGLTSPTKSSSSRFIDRKHSFSKSDFIQPF